MKSPVSNIIFILAILLTSCNTEKIKELEQQVNSLLVTNSNLKNDLRQVQMYLEETQQDLYSSSDQINSLKRELQFCEFNAREYRFGNGICITRYSGGRQKEVCGAEDVINFLNSHYCP